MAKSPGDIEGTLSHLMHAAAVDYGHALSKYADAYTAYGKGEVDAAHAVASAVNMMIGEVAKSIHVGFNLATSYARWAGSLMGVDELNRNLARSGVPLRKSSESKPAKTGRRSKSAKRTKG